MPQIKLKDKGPIAIAVLLETEDKKLVMQLRDNKKGIHYPGCWSIITGGLDESDWDGDIYSSTEQGAKRELAEELFVVTEDGEVPFQPEKMVLIDEGRYPDKKEDYEDYQYTFYVRLNVPFERLRLKEGQKLGLFPREKIRSLEIANSYKDVIFKFIEG